jgi:hypothetical protein
MPDMPTVEFQDPMAFGKGIQSLQLRPRGDGVVGDAPPPASGSQTVEFALRKIESYDDYQKALGFDADASASYGLFHGSAKFDWSEQHKYTSFSRYLVASITVTNEFQQLANPKLTPSAAALLAAGNTDRFYDEFGDSFVLGITTGGAYFALLEFTSQSESDLSKISATLDVGEYGVFSGQASFSSAVQRFSGQTSLKVDSFQLGGTDTTQAVAVDSIIAKAAGFAPEVQQKAAKFTAFLQDYQTLDLPAGPNPVDIDNARLVLQNYTPLRNQLVERLNEIEYVQIHPDQFVNPQNFDLVSLQSQVSAALRQITSNASVCADSIKNCQFPDVAIPAVTLPPRKDGAPAIPQVQVPDLSAIPNNIPSFARQKLTQLGLQFTVSGPDQITQNGIFLNGHVTSTAPPAGTMVNVGSVVSLQIGNYQPSHLGHAH